jgi:2-haloacid dehalogenase
MTVALRPRLLAFDVNETLLDLKALRIEVARVIGMPAGEWLSGVLHASLVSNEVGAYRPFDQIGREVMIELAASKGISVSRDEAGRVIDIMSGLPAQPGVYNCLERLFDEGFAMVALTNGSTVMANTQVENAGLHVFLQRVISVEEVGLFKPAVEVYTHAAKVMATPLAEMMMVAAHAWDCAGALASGARAAFISPRGHWPMPGPRPELISGDIIELTAHLVVTT